MFRTRFRTLVALSAVLALGFLVGPRTLQADHAWGGYHWARLTNPLSLSIGDNVTNAWDSFLATAESDWDNGAAAFGLPDVLALNLVPGATSPRTCKPLAGTIQVCNAAYGLNGWLGVAQIWADGSGHISQATTKINDSYFALAQYNNIATKRFVMCQEVGHTFGLDHQDEDFDNPNLGSCMDYTSLPGGGGDQLSNEHPNYHDFEELALIYNHFDTPTGGGGGGGGGNGRGRSGAFGIREIFPAVPGQSPDATPGDWGTLMRANRGLAVYELDLGGGRRLVTFVIWS